MASKSFFEKVFDPVPNMREPRNGGGGVCSTSRVQSRMPLSVIPDRARYSEKANARDRKSFPHSMKSAPRGPFPRPGVPETNRMQKKGKDFYKNKNSETRISTVWTEPPPELAASGEFPKKLHHSVRRFFEKNERDTKNFVDNPESDNQSGEWV